MLAACIGTGTGIEVNVNMNMDMNRASGNVCSSTAQAMLESSKNLFTEHYYYNTIRM
jgi:hypothetical protein